jgi:hypothetical protein
MSLKSTHVKKRIAVWAVVALSLSSVGATFLIAQVPDTRLMDSNVVEEVRGQVELLKWVGGSMVSGLVAAVLYLVKQLQNERDEVKRVVEISSAADTKLSDSIDGLKNELCTRPCMAKKKEQG